VNANLKHVRGPALLCALLAAGLLAPVLARQAPGKVELKLKLPRPIAIGTPSNIRSTNLEDFTGRPRPPFMVPEGTTLLSLDKPVTASEELPLWGELPMLTDGEKEGGDGYVIEMSPGQQWVQVDLGASFALHAILVWHYHSQMRVYRDVVVQVSDDESFTSGVTTVFNNDHDNTGGLGAGRDKEYIEVYEGRLIDPGGAVGRYVRLYSNGNTTDDLNHYIEVEVYGTPPE